MRSPPEALRRARSTYATLAPYGRPYRGRLAGGFLATLVLVASRLAFPWPLRGLMEIVFHKSAHGRGRAVVALVPHVGDPLWWLVGAFVAIVLLWGVSESAQRLAFTQYAVGLVRDARDAAVLALPAAAAGREAGDLIAAVTGDAARVKSGVKSVLIGTSRNGAFFVGAAVVIGLIDPTIALVFVAGGVATVVAAAVGAWRSARIARRSRLREGGLTGELHRFLAGGAELAVAGGGATGAPKAKAMRVEALTTFAVHVILGAATCAILVLAIEAGRSGRLSPGSVFTILAYVLLMHNKTVGFGRRIVRIGRLLASAERLAAVLRHRDPPATTEQEVIPPAGGPAPVLGFLLSFLMWPR